MSGPHKGGRDYFAPGDWNEACGECGRKRKASELVRNWQGLYKCPEHNEPRHPQEYVRAVPDIQTPPHVQPETDTFAGVCFPNDQTCINGYAVADCAICDYVSPFFMPDTYIPDVTVTVAYVGIEHWQSSTASALAVLPPGVKDGDILILCAAPDTAGNALTTPSGWTEFSSSPLTGAFPYRTRVFWKVAASEPLSYTLTRGAIFTWHGFVIAYRDCNVVAPINAETSTIALVSNTTWVSSGLVTTADNTRVVTILSVQNGSQQVAFGHSGESTTRGTFTYPSLPNFEPLFIQDNPQLVAGSAGSFSGVVTPAGLWLSMSIALASL